nr:hypothetical protein CFP56_75564 [Quercus suber]
MAAFIKILNRLLPFATPGTPLLQDLVHLAAVCAVLYFGPQIQERLRRPRVGETGDAHAPPQGLPAEHAGVANVGDALPAHGGAEQVEREEDDGDGSDDDDDGDVDEFEGPGDGALDEEDQRNPAAQAGPAQNPNLPAARDVGAKKAKSIARRDQRRAYHEFQRLLKGTNVLGKRDGAMTFVTEKGWVVRVGEDDMRKVYQRALQQNVGGEDGTVKYAVLGQLLEQDLR